MCCCLVTKSCLTLCNPMGCNPPVSSVHGFSQARILEWVAISYSKGSPSPRDQTCISCTGGQIPYHWATRGAHLMCQATLKIKFNKWILQHITWTLCRPVVCQPNCTSGSPVELSKKKSTIIWGPAPEILTSLVWGGVPGISKKIFFKFFN